MKKIFFLVTFLVPFLISAQWVQDLKIPTTDVQLVKGAPGDFFSYSPGGYISKRNASSLVPLWSRALTGATISDLLYSTTNELYVFGSFSLTLSVGSFSLSSYGGQDLFLLKMDASGNPLWLKQIGSKGLDAAGGICESNNSLLLTGGVTDTAWFSNQLIPKTSNLDLFVTRLDMNGAFQNVKLAEGLPWNYGPPANGVSGGSGGEIKTDGSGNIIVLFPFRGRVKIDTTVREGDYATGLLKLDASLNLAWFSLVIDDLSSNFNGLHIDSQNNILYLQQISSHYTDYSIIHKLDPAGTTLYTRYFFDSGHIWDIDLDASDNVNYTGYWIRWFYSANPPDKYFFKTGQLSPALQDKWLIQDSSYQWHFGSDIITLTTNDLIVSGGYQDTIILKDTLLGSSSTTFHFLAKLSTGTSVAVNDLTAKATELILSPNPSAGLLSLQLKDGQAIRSYCIYDMNGRCVESQATERKVVNIDMSMQPKGIYFLEVSQGKDLYRRKVVIE